MTERAAVRLPEPVDVLELDVNVEDDLAALTDTLRERWGGVDGVLHAIAYAPQDALGGHFMTAPANSAIQAIQTSAFSFKALAAATAPLMQAGSSIVGLDFDATVAWPIYDWMGVAKAALESVSRYLARDLGRWVSASTSSAPARSGRSRRAESPGSGSWLRPGSLRLRSVGTRRTLDRSRMRCVCCCRITRVRSRARSSTSTAAFTLSARLPFPRREDYVEGWLERERNVRILALLGAPTIAFSSILVRLSHASPSTAAIFRCVYALPFLGLLKWLEDRRYGARSWRQRRTAIGAGVFFAADLILWTHRSRTSVPASRRFSRRAGRTGAADRLDGAIRATRQALLMALPLTAIGVLMISGLLEHGAYGRDPGSGALFGVSAGIAYAGFILLLRHGGADLRRPAGPLFDATATAAVVAVIVGVVVGDARLVPTWPSAGWLLTLALSSQVLGWMLITISLPRLPAGDHIAAADADAGSRDPARRAHLR